MRDYTDNERSAAIVLIKFYNLQAGTSFRYNNEKTQRHALEALDRVQGDLKMAKNIVRAYIAENAEDAKTGNGFVECFESIKAAIEIVDFECGEWRGLANTIEKRLSDLPSAQPERPEQPESAKEYCAECDHIEMCRWYPYEGCEFRSLPSAQPELCDDPMADIYYLAEEIGIHRLYELVVALRGESEQRWIPCEERLPKDEKNNYWVCTDTGYQCECRWTNINHIWTYLTTNWHWHIADIPQYSSVIAWMPLPEPYRKEGENGENDV